MKLLAADLVSEVAAPLAGSFQLREGLIGLTDFTQAELAVVPDQFPFLSLELRGPQGAMRFIVLQPDGFIDGYEPEIFPADAAALGISEPAEAMLLNIVTLEAQNPAGAKVNLVGPIVVNRRTRVGRQLVISNYASYDPFHPLMETAQRAVAS